LRRPSLFFFPEKKIEWSEGVHEKKIRLSPFLVVPGNGEEKEAPRWLFSSLAAGGEILFRGPRARGEKRSRRSRQDDLRRTGGKGKLTLTRGRGDIPDSRMRGLTGRRGTVALFRRRLWSNVGGGDPRFCGGGAASAQEKEE